MLIWHLLSRWGRVFWGC